MVATSIEMTAVGFEPTQLALVELESTPLDHSGKLSLQCITHCTTLTGNSIRLNYIAFRVLEK